MCSLIDLLGRALAHDEGLEGLAVLGFELRKAVACLLGDNRNLGGHNLCECDAHITHGRTRRTETIVEHVVGNVDELHRVALTTELALDDLLTFLVHGYDHGGIDAQFYGYVAHDAANLILCQLESAECYFFSLPTFTVGCRQHEVLLLIGWVVEVRRHDGVGGPSFSIGIGGHNLLLATQLVLMLLVSLLRHLVVFYLALQLDGCGTNAKLRVDE